MRSDMENLKKQVCSSILIVQPLKWSASKHVYQIINAEFEVYNMLLKDSRMQQSFCEES